MKKNNVEGFATAGNKDKQINQWNKTGTAEINPSIYGPLVYHHEVDITEQWRKHRLFNKWCWVS